MAALLLTNAHKMIKKRPGITIVEVLTAAAIFSLAILALFATFSFALRFTQHSKNITVASAVGQQLIEDLRLGGFDSVALNANPSAVAVSELSGGYTKTYVSYYLDNDKIKEVTIKVYWTGRPENQAVTFTTLIGQGGISG